VRAVQAGAIGYLLKDTKAAELRRAIKAAAAYLLRKVQAEASHETLTGREAEVLQLLAQGQSNKEIARTLQVGEDTVKTHVGHIFA